MFDFFENFDWLDIGIAGALSEQIADDEKEIKEIEKDYEDDDDSGGVV